MADDLRDMPVRLTNEAEMENTRLAEPAFGDDPSQGTLDYRRFLGAPWPAS
jgi:hypothetical protein